MAAIDGRWLEKLRGEFHKEYYGKLFDRVREEYKTHVCYPSAGDIFNAFHYTQFDEVKAVILGQDPYHEPGQAHGLSFSVNPGVEIPPSLENIFRELHDDIGCEIPKQGCLVKWAREGVLLLNSVLTVRAHRANSHKGIGWEEFTDAAVRALCGEDRPIVFILWGSQAQMKRPMITNPKHLVLAAPHPSPLSAFRGFFGSRPFSRTNEFLIRQGERRIDWEI